MIHKVSQVHLKTLQLEHMAEEVVMASHGRGTGHGRVVGYGRGASCGRGTWCSRGAGCCRRADDDERLWKKEDPCGV